MNEFDKKLLLEAAFWHHKYFKHIADEGFSIRDAVLDVCDNVALEINDDDLDEVLEAFEELI